MIIFALVHPTSADKFDVVFGEVLEKGLPVINAEVRLKDETSYTNKEGKFFLESLPGNYQLTIIPPDSPGVRFSVPLEIRIGEQKITVELTDLTPEYSSRGLSANWFVSLELFDQIELAIKMMRQARAAASTPTNPNWQSDDRSSR